MAKCPTCKSTAPHLHPAVQFEGEVETCPDAFHLQPTPQNAPQYIALVEAKRSARGMEPPPMNIVPSMASEMAPCPFCGSPDLHAFVHVDGEESYGFQCARCWMTGPHFGSKTEAVSAWNRRPPLAPDEAALVALDDAIKALEGAAGVGSVGWISEFNDSGRRICRFAAQGLREARAASHIEARARQAAPGVQGEVANLVDRLRDTSQTDLEHWRARLLNEAADALESLTKGATPVALVEGDLLRAAKAIEPELFSDDPKTAYRAASPHNVDVRREQELDRLRVALSALQAGPTAPTPQPKDPI